MTTSNQNFQNLTIKLSIMKWYVISFILMSLVSCSNSKNLNNTNENTVRKSSGLTYKIIKIGIGTAVKEGQEVILTEKVKFLNDSLAFPNKVVQPFKTVLNKENMIDGVREGVIGMRVGELRKLVVPPSLSRRVAGDNFPYKDSTLIFEIELLEIVGAK